MSPEKIITALGPMLSSQLGQILVSQYGLSSTAARQQISRAKSLHRFGYLKFPKNAQFLYKQDQYMSPYFWDALRKALIETGSAYGRAIVAIEARGGVIPKSHFSIVCGSPLNQRKHLSQNIILDNLLKSKILENIELPGVGECLALARTVNNVDQKLFASTRARLITENILLKAVRTWAQNLGIASYNKILIRDEGEKQPQVGTFTWDLSGPSYLSPMVSWTAEQIKPGFLTCDVLLGARVNENEMNTFIHKCTTLKSLKKVGRTLHIFIADRYFTAAFKLGKEHGVITTTPDALFGREVAEGLRELTTLLKQVSLSSPEVVVKLFDKLSTIEGAAINLSGALFEFMVGHLVYKKTGANITLNRIFKNGPDSAEVDVVAVHGDRSIHFIECKGYQSNSNIADAEVTKWLTKTIPLVRAVALNHPDWKDYTMHFEFWTTGKFSPESQAQLAKAKANTKKYVIDYKDSYDVLKYAKDVNDSSLLKTLKEHFIEHPLSDIKSALPVPITASARPIAPYIEIQPNFDSLKLPIKD